MNKPVLFIQDKKKNEYRVVVEAIPDWEGFDKLIKYLEINYKAHILESYDGPDARRCIIDIQDRRIELIHSDGYGNYLLASTLESQALIKEIGEDLEKRLMDDET